MALEVTLTSLDTFCEARGIYQIDVIKVDVEGSELAVFEGAKTLLARHRIGRF